MSGRAIGCFRSRPTRQVDPQPRGSERFPLTLIEKFARSRIEARFQESFQRLPTRPDLDLLPRVHSTLTCGAMPDAVFFTAASYRVPLVTNLPVSDAELGAIAGRIAALGDAGVPLPEGASLQSAGISRFAASVRKDSRADSDALRQVTVLERQLPALVNGVRWSEIPRSAAHRRLAPREHRSQGRQPHPAGRFRLGSRSDDSRRVRS